MKCFNPLVVDAIIISVNGFVEPHNKPAVVTVPYDVFNRFRRWFTNISNEDEFINIYYMKEHQYKSMIQNLLNED